MENLEKYLQIAIEAARAGAKIALANFGNSNDARVKGNAKGLVTQTDLDAEKAILEILLSKTSFKVLSEESGLNGKSEGPVWVVDPLDGTNNFAHSLPFFAVSVALMNGNESWIGVIIDPVLNKEYSAAKGKGAFCNGKKFSAPVFNNEYIPTVFLNHGYNTIDRLKFQQLSKIFARETNILKLGTTALELCYVATGAADAFICSGDELWDFAAGIVIAREAGILFTDWKGKDWNGKNDHLLFAKPFVHAKLVEQIKDLQ